VAAEKAGGDNAGTEPGLVPGRALALRPSAFAGPAPTPTNGGAGVEVTQHHPAPWWYKLAERFFPTAPKTNPTWFQTWRDRCREIPEAQNPDRIVLRQFAVIKRYVYLQQFASHEDAEWMHSHQWYRTIAIGLWGWYIESRLAGRAARVRAAPYLYTMDDSVIHHVAVVSPGHTSIFIGLWRNDDLKHYYRADHERRLWSDHIKKMVKRI
jgi:hypothetical protein